jgi:uncharacterized protein (TIGR04540 family)
VITYFTTQLALTKSLLEAIDKYLNLELEETEFIKYIKQVSENNEELLFKDDDYTAIVKQKLGVKRLSLLDKILERNK